MWLRIEFVCTTIYSSTFGSRLVRMSSVSGPDIRKKCATSNVLHTKPFTNCNSNSTVVQEEQQQVCSNGNGTTTTCYTVVDFIKRVKRSTLGWILRRRRTYDFQSGGDHCRRHSGLPTTNTIGDDEQTSGGVSVGYRCTNHF